MKCICVVAFANLKDEIKLQNKRRCGNCRFLKNTLCSISTYGTNYYPKPQRCDL